jgi:hypothetical protein
MRQEDERPIMSSGKYNFQPIEEEKAPQKVIPVQKVVEEEDDYYSDDFESYESDFESESDEEFY